MMSAVLRVVRNQSGEHVGHSFYCPGCSCEHHVDLSWQFNGDFTKPTLTPSVLVNGRPEVNGPGMLRCHSFVRDGRLEFLSDCDHALAGSVVDIPESR